MRAILLAAGFGTRLRPLTDSIPKCLVPIRGEPLLNIWLDKLMRTDLLPVLINTHYLPQQVALFVESSSHRDYVTVVYEPELLGTAGTLRANLDFYQGQDGLLIHSDNLCQQNLQDLVVAHHQRPPSGLRPVPRASRLRSPPAGHAQRAWHVRPLLARHRQDACGCP